MLVKHNVLEAVNGVPSLSPPVSQNLAIEPALALFKELDARPHVFSSGDRAWISFFDDQRVLHCYLTSEASQVRYELSFDGEVLSGLVASSSFAEAIRLMFIGKSPASYLKGCSLDIF